MRVCIAPKIVIRVFTVLTLSASLVCATVSAARHGDNTGSAFANQEAARKVFMNHVVERANPQAISDKPSGSGAGIIIDCAERTARSP